MPADHSTNPHAGDVTLALERFEAAWSAGSPPPLSDFLPESAAAETRREALLALVAVDLECRWRARSKVAGASVVTAALDDSSDFLRLEDYVAEYPDIGAVETLPLDLIVEEYRIRWRFGDRPGHQHYRDRFAAQEHAILIALTEVDKELADEAPSDDELADDELADDETTMQVTLGQFEASLTESGLLSADEVRDFRNRLTPPPQSAADLAIALIRGKRLTRFQAHRIAKGNAGDLVFDEYVIEDKIGEGGMGEVFKARHRRMKRYVAIKVISPKVIESPIAVQRFLREVEAAAQLNHPNIVTAYDAREADGKHYLIMEYVDGRDLSALASATGLLPVRQAVNYVIQAARGLEYAHGRGIIHRDIKPSNLLVDENGTVKILDMGLARFNLPAKDDDATEQLDLTHSGQVMGTVDYMAPEQARNAHNADEQSDIYSLGCTLYRLLTGRPLYEGDTVVEKILAHNNDPVPSLHKACAFVPEELDAVFQKMVAKRPAERQQSARQLIAELERASAAFDSPPASPGALDATAVRLAPPVRAVAPTVAEGDSQTYVTSTTAQSPHVQPAKLDQQYTTTSGAATVAFFIIWPFATLLLFVIKSVPTLVEKLLFETGSPFFVHGPILAMHLIQGAALSALAITLFSRRNQFLFARNPGFNILVVGGLQALLSVLVSAAVHSLLVVLSRGETYPYAPPHVLEPVHGQFLANLPSVVYALVGILFAAVYVISALLTRAGRGWRICFVVTAILLFAHSVARLLGFPFGLMLPFALAAVVVPFVVTDLVQRAPRIWLHWLGLAYRAAWVIWLLLLWAI